MVCGATTPLEVPQADTLDVTRFRQMRVAVTSISLTGALDIVKRKAGEHARTYYIVRCRSCGRLGSYEPLDQAQARVDQHRSHSSQADHEVVITKHPQTKA
jgi:hypothetical protein